MPATIVIVQNDQAFLQETAGTLQRAGYTVATFDDSMAVLNALGSPGTIDAIRLLITDMTFPPGSPQGISLATMLKLKRPYIRVVFTGAPMFASATTELGTFVPLPTTPRRVLEVVSMLVGVGARSGPE